MKMAYSLRCPAEKAIGTRILAPTQAAADLDRLAELIQRRAPQGEPELEQLRRRYRPAASPDKGASATTAYRLRLLFLDRRNLWRRLTPYRIWHDSQGQTLDGTNNGKRAIGWWIKERYRTMRGYKRVRSALNVSRLLAWCGNRQDRGGVNLAQIVA